jgi:hypothetical protein
VRAASLPQGNAANVQLVMFALKAVVERPTPQVANEQAAAVSNALREAGVRDTSWVPFLMTNMMKVASGTDPRAAAWFKGNAGHLPGLREAASGLLARAERQGFARRPGDGFDGPAQARDQAARFFNGAHRADEATTAQLGALLRKGGFKQAAVSDTVKLLGAYTEMRGSVGYNDKFYAKAKETEALAQRAYSAGTISKKTRDQLLAEVNHWRRTYPEAKRAEVVSSADAKRRQVIDATTKLVDDIKYLKGTLDARNGFSFSPLTSLHVNVARQVIAKRLPELEAALASGDLDRMKGAMATAQDQLKAYGGARGLATKLEADHKAALKGMERVADIVGMLPGVGPFARLMFSGSLEALKYASNEQTAAQALTNTALKALNVKLGPALSGAGPGKALLTALNGSLQSFTKDAAGILSDKNTSWQQVPGKLEGAARKAVVAGFKSAIEGQLKVLASSSERATAYKLFLDAATKLGLDPVLKPYIDRFKE